MVIYATYSPIGTPLPEYTPSDKKAIPTRNLSTSDLPSHKQLRHVHTTPLADAVALRGSRTFEAPFHVPGHKRGACPAPPLDSLLGPALRYDLTELDGLDYLSSPDGPILEAQRLAAEAWGAGATWFLVNGSTVGIHAAVMATCIGGQNDALILARNAHLSAFNAAALAGCTPVYAAPVTTCGLAHHVTPNELERAFADAHARGLCPRAAVVVSPTYYGVISDIAALAAVCHKHNAALVVDEAHGAHLHFLPLIENSHSLTLSAVQAGADLVVQSTHKVLGALTPGAMLHLSRESLNKRIDPKRVSRVLQMLQTSSPSYLVMASLDAARAQAQDASAVTKAHSAAVRIQEWFEQLQTSVVEDSAPLRLLRPQDCVLGHAMAQGGAEGNSPPSHQHEDEKIASDPWRFTVLLDETEIRCRGWEIAAMLEKECGLVAETATHNAVVFAAGIGTTMEHADRFIQGFEWLLERINYILHIRKRMGQEIGTNMHLLGCSGRFQAQLFPTAVLTPRDALAASTVVVPSSEVVGRVSAELICPYPPGIPLVYPGELLEEGILLQLQAVIAAGGKVVGAADATLGTFRVVR